MTEQENSKTDKISVFMKNATATWTVPVPPAEKSSKINGKKSRTKLAIANDRNTLQSPTLSHLNVNFPKGKLIGVIGPVGAGKSSLLQILLGELPLDSGTMSIHGTTSYASQEVSWLNFPSCFGIQFISIYFSQFCSHGCLLRQFDKIFYLDKTMIIIGILVLLKVVLYSGIMNNSKIAIAQ